MTDSSAFYGDELKLANKIFTIFNGNLMLLNNWGVYLFLEDFDSEPELKNKVSVIWFGALLDIAEVGANRLPKYRQESLDAGMNTFKRYCNQAQEFIDSAIDILKLYTKEQQVFISEHRNQLVHGYLGGHHSDQKRIKYIDQNGDFKTENITQEEYRSINRRFYENRPLDELLPKLMARALDRRFKYWHVIHELKTNHDKIYHELIHDKEYDWFTLDS